MRYMSSRTRSKSFEGVNLGGWLLVERWMTPSLFKDTDAKDEYSLMQTPNGASRIKKHRDTYMTEEDWKWLAAHEVTHVRVPIGYWALHDDPPYVNAKARLDWAFRMAEKYDIKILLDLHALKGSQNGTIHSGKIGPVEWRGYEQESLDTLKELATCYRDSKALWGLEIINEPKVLGNYIALLRYYRDAYKVVRKILKPGTYTVFQDGFLPLFFSGVLWATKGHPVIMDTHFYLAFPNILSNLLESFKPSSSKIGNNKSLAFSPLLVKGCVEFLCIPNDVIYSIDLPNAASIKALGTSL